MSLCPEHIKFYVDSLEGESKRLAGEVLQSTNSGLHEILRKSMPKWIPKKIKIGTQNDPKSDF